MSQKSRDLLEKLRAAVLHCVHILTRLRFVRKKVRRRKYFLKQKWLIFRQDCVRDNVFLGKRMEILRFLLCAPWILRTCLMLTASFQGNSRNIPSSPSLRLSRKSADNILRRVQRLLYFQICRRTDSAIYYHWFTHAKYIYAINL